MSEAEWKTNQNKMKTNFYANSKIGARIEKLSEKEKKKLFSTALKRLADLEAKQTNNKHRV